LNGIIFPITDWTNLIIPKLTYRLIATAWTTIMRSGFVIIVDLWERYELFIIVILYHTHQIIFPHRFDYFNIMQCLFFKPFLEYLAINKIFINQSINCL
jgi:hypothetical protein